MLKRVPFDWAQVSDAARLRLDGPQALAILLTHSFGTLLLEHRSFLALQGAFYGFQFDLKSNPEDLKTKSIVYRIPVISCALSARPDGPKAIK